MKKILILLFCTVALMFLVSTYSLKISDKLYDKSEKIETSNYLRNIENGKRIEQKIIAKYNNFQRIDIEFEPFKEKSNISGKITIGIDDSEGKNIAKQEIIRNYVREKNTYEFTFSNQKDSLNMEYTFWIEFNKIDNESEFISIRTDDNGKLAIQEYYKNSNKEKFFYIIIIFFSIYIVFFDIYIYNKKEIKIEQIFICTVPVICIFYILTIPNFKNHDELYHWYKSYEVSLGYLRTEIKGNRLGTKMPKSIKYVATDNWKDIDYGIVKQSLNIELQPEETEYIYAETSAVYSAIQYIPQAIGIWIARIFTKNVLLLAYAGRIMNMIVSMICIFFAIKKIPFGKQIILILSYIPIAIEGFSSLSPDAMTISVSFLYISYIMKLAFNDKNNFIEKKQLMFLTMMSIIIALCKIVYIPLTLLLFIIPKEKFKNGKKTQNIIIIIIVASIINLIWLKIASRYLLFFREGDSSIQLKTIFENPINYLQKCLYTLNINFGTLIANMFGQNLGWDDLIPIYDIVPYSFYVMILFIICIDRTIKDKFKKYQKYIMTIITLSISFLIFTSLYIQWTTYGSDSILGIQGRYFIPIFPLVAFLIGSSLKIKTSYKDEEIQKMIGIVGATLQILVISQSIISHL